MDFPFSVSRETKERLRLFEVLLLKWQKTHNLVSRETIADIWGRHIIDSAQLLPLIETESVVADMGSGGGFPGVVLSILGLENLSLMESNHKKCSFLREVRRQLSLSFDVYEGRIEESALNNLDVVTSRALASLDQLLSFSHPLLKKEGRCIFLKGRSAAEEINEARQKWSFDLEQKESITSSDGTILILKHVRPKIHEDHIHSKPEGRCGENHDGR